MTGGAGADDPVWDGLFDEEFVRGGRPEASADERAAKAQRIARDHGRAQPWRAAAGPPGAPRKRRAGRALPAIVLVLVLALAGWTWHLSRPGTSLGQPAPAPAGEGGFVFSATKDDGSGRPVTFDPCKPIHYVVRPDGAPPSGQAMVAAAIAEVSRATGLVFIGDGVTGEAPSRNRHSREQWPLGDEAAPVLIAWSTAAESPDLAGDVAGFAGPVQVAPSGPGTARYVSGQVVLDAEDLAHAPGDALGQEAVRLVLLHELAHLVGLAHVADPAQLMFPEATPVTGYAPGDLRGLHELGLGECF